MAELRVWPELPTELAEHVSSFLHPNERACTLRLLSKAAATLFRGPQHTTVRLSQPSPPQAFAWRWAPPGATRGMSYPQRLQLLCLTAASGSIANLELALSCSGCLLNCKVLEAAAAAGQLQMCRWLRGHGCPLGGALAAAAEGGQRELCEWLLGGADDAGGGASSPSADVPWAAAAAARGGHPEVTEWLMQAFPQHFAPGAVPPPAGAQLLAVAAEGCDLPTLQRLHHEWLERGSLAAANAAEAAEAPNPVNASGPGGVQAGWRPHQDLSNHDMDFIVSAVAGSGSADWRAKLEWLESRGYPKTTAASWGAATCPGGEAVERFVWLHRHGHPVNLTVSMASAARLGNLAAVQYLASLVSAHQDPPQHMAAGAACRAAERGHLEVVAWLVETPRVGLTLVGGLMDAAALSGRLELLRWLRGHGCPWGEDTFASAASGGNEEALEWLVEQGCPMRYADGRPYVNACRNNDLATLRCLARLGCPFGSDVGCTVFAQSIDIDEVGPPTLRALLEAGCPVDWEGAEQAVRGARGAAAGEVLSVLAEERRRRQGHRGAAA